jgi:hypothetical protein
VTSCLIDTQSLVFTLMIICIFISALVKILDVAHVALCVFKINNGHGNCGFLLGPNDY